MYIIYALFFKNRKMIYVGMTNDLERRIGEHKNGKTRSTRDKGDFFVKIIEKYNFRIEARKREKYWKSGCGKEKLKNLAG